MHTCVLIMQRKSSTHNQLIAYTVTRAKNVTCRMTKNDKRATIKQILINYKYSLISL